MEPSFAFVNMHVTVSPASILNVAVLVSVSPVEGVPPLSASSQEMLVRVQPVLFASVTVYVPGVKSPEVNVPLLVLIVPVTSPLNLKLLVPPTIVFWTMREPNLVFVNVQVIVSPAATSRLIGVSPLSQMPPSELHPARDVSATVKEPGTTS